MEYLKDIERLGGLRKMYEPSVTTLSQEEIKDIEDELGTNLPDDLSYFLTHFGISDFINEPSLKPLSKDAVYTHGEDSNQPDFFFEESSIGVFYGKDPKEGAYDLFWNIKNYKERMPEKFIPFASDGMGNQIVMSLNEKDYENVFFWDHEAEWDAEDYFEETGNQMPEEVKYQNLWLLAKSFDDFFQRLEN